MASQLQPPVEPATTSSAATSEALETSTSATAPLAVPTSPQASVATTIETPAAANGSAQPSTTPVAPSDTPASALNVAANPPPVEPEADFTGNVNVTNDKPTQADLEKCADMLVLDAQGASRPFKSLYAGEGVAPRQLIIFVRHFFCGQCQEYLRTLSSSITPESLLSLDTPTFITVIGCGRPDLIEMYTETTSCPFPIYADPTRKLYDTLGMTRTLDLGKKPQYTTAGLFATTVQSIMQGLRSGRQVMNGGDYKQVGGEFLFENGEVIWCHRMRNTRDHAEVPELRKLLGLDDTKPPMRKRWSHGIKGVGRRSGSWGRPKDGKLEEKGGRRSASIARRVNERSIEEERPEAEEQTEATKPAENGVAKA
ncbi:hypothetical protein BU16DRAFT_7415 [Lophium mytilinum]|uniref:AhpC-TSA-domain-containing protein n=1 Tax=Lophium mytilinum TaxID=390894 RepID=A0A6A6RDC9_9PEZI|nr:hypothetical protein BU16DRAFT_7415 [Lophium mytilinum]